jgi:hypothetical protein
LAREVLGRLNKVKFKSNDKEYAMKEMLKIRIIGK